MSLLVSRVKSAGTSTQDRHGWGFRPSRYSLAPGGWLSGLLIGAGSKKGQTAWMPTRGGYSCRVKD